MHKESALAALQTLDVIVYKSSHHELSQDDLGELRSACSGLVQSVQDNTCVATKAAWVVELVEKAFQGGVLKSEILREEILKAGISLSIFIHQQADSDLAEDEKSAG